MQAFLNATAGELKATVEHPGSFPEGFPARGDGGGQMARAVLEVAALLGDGKGLDGVAGERVSVVISVKERSASVLVKANHKEA